LGTKRTEPGFIEASGTESITPLNRTGPPLTVTVMVSLTSCSVHFVMERPGMLCQPVPDVVAGPVVHFAACRSVAPLKLWFTAA